MLWQLSNFISRVTPQAYFQTCGPNHYNSEIGMQQSQSFVQEAIEWYKTVLSRFSDFEGRAGRREFWMFVLVNFIVAVALSIVEGILHLRVGGFGILSGLYSLAVLVPGVAVGIRRLHDTGKSGMFLLLVFIPIFGAIALIYFYAIEGDHGANEYGADPKAVDESVQRPMRNDVHPR